MIFSPNPVATLFSARVNVRHLVYYEWESFEQLRAGAYERPQETMDLFENGEATVSEKVIKKNLISASVHIQAIYIHDLEFLPPHLKVGVIFI